MFKQERKTSYITTNSYETLNTLTKKTKNVWIVLHGIGYLSKYFLNYFDELPAVENYIIAPQAPSKYYLKNEYRHVGASWLTKENTVMETKNVFAYLDAVFCEEQLPAHYDLIVFGFSQGVSIATRWAAHRQLKCTQLILYAGGIPNELTASDLDFLQQNNTKVTVLVGDKDEYLTKEILKKETLKIKTLFNNRADQLIFKGGHEIKKGLINELIE